MSKVCLNQVAELTLWRVERWAILHFKRRLVCYETSKTKPKSTHDLSFQVSLKLHNS